MASRDDFLATYTAATATMTTAIGQAISYVAPSFPDSCPLKKEAQRFIVEGGKRLRPALSLVIAEYFGHADPFVHVALETFHKYLLTHDDIIDRDEVRYGVPTVQAQLQRGCPLHSEREHFGHALAIIAGNLMEAATHKIILCSRLSPSKILALEKLIVQAVEEVTWGWHDQFVMDYMPLGSPELTFARIEKSMIWVTGKYSIKLPLLFGYAVAGRRPPKGLEALADTIGALYQTGDDLIGLFGKEEDTGKSSFGDITQGKKTLPMWLTYQGASAKDKALLRRCVGKADITPHEIAEVRAIIHRSGGFVQTTELIQRYCDRANVELAAANLPPPIHTFLQGFIDFLQTRDR